MRGTALVGGTLAICAVPLVGVLAMVVGGAAAIGPAIAVMVATSLAGLAWTIRLARDIERLEEMLRGAAGEAALFAHAGEEPAIPAMARVGRSIERLARGLADRATQAERLLRANEAIVERLPDPLLVLGADHAVRRANAAARGAFGGDMAAVLRHPTLRAAFDRALDQRTPQTADLHLAVPVPREVQATVIWLDPPFTGGAALLAVLSDRTRERAIERTRADFVANSSHELRTPLASLIGFIDTLRGPAADDPPAQTRFLSIMAEQAQRMSRLIDDLLSLSRIELTEHLPPSDRVDLAAVVAHVAEAFEPRVASRGITLRATIASDLPRVVADHDQMMQVVQNLVDNAVKYGREGGTVRIAAAVATAGVRWPARPGLVVAVTDDGPGIARAQLPRLTERFYRVDKGRSRNAGGTGLGLAIVKHIVNRHRGQLLIESEEGKGSTFSVWLPVPVELPGREA